MTYCSFKLPLVTILLFVVLLLIAPAGVHAESTVVTYQVDGALSPGFMESSYNIWLWAARSPNVQVRYSAAAVNEATGESVCGAVVPVGTKIRLRHPDLQDHDITWNATGGAWDTPYGYWKKDAAFPGLYCEENDYSSSFISEAWGSIRFYTPFSVAPPSRSITIAKDNLSCEKSADGSEVCTAMKIGEAGVSFDIASTYGRYYFHTRASYNTSSACAGMLASSWFGLGLIRPTEPMRLFDYRKWDRGPIGTGDAGYVINDGWGINGYDTWPWLKGMTHAVVWSGSNIPQPYDVPIPAASIKCPITIVPPIGAPSAPTVTSTSCTVGTSLELAFTSTDPNGHKLRFGVDWDDDGTVDQFVPPSGYVPSGSEQSAKRTFAIVGEKHVAVMVENDRGAHSEWTHYSFICAEAPEEDDTSTNEPGDNDNITPGDCPIGYEYQGGACVFVSCPIGYIKIINQCVFATCPVGYTQQADNTCLWSGCPANFTEKDGQCVMETACASLPYCQGNDLLNGCTHEVIENCMYGCALGRCKYAPQVSASISATPSLVKQGQSTKLSWTSKNASACAVTSTNGDSYSGLIGGNKLSEPLSSVTTFTLHCDALQGATPSFIEKSVTVSVRPDYEEK